jgi:hypothetical protein
MKCEDRKHRTEDRKQYVKDRKQYVEDRKLPAKDRKTPNDINGLMLLLVNTLFWTVKSLSCTLLIVTK